MIESVVPYLPALTNGLLLTLFYFALGALGSMLLALPVALAMGSASLFVRYPTIAYVEFFRNTPLLVQLFWMHFALPAVTGLNTTAHQTAGLAIVIVMTAYMAEIYRAGLNTVSRGQHEAGLALGLKPAQRWGLIVIPQAFPIALPAIGNTLVSLLKPLLNEVGKLVANLLDGLVGIKIGQTDVHLMSLECDNVRLVY